MSEAPKRVALSLSEAEDAAEWGPDWPKDRDFGGFYILETHHTAEVTRLEAEVARLREALRPFSEEASWWFTRNYNADDVPVEGFGDYEPVMTCGDLFNARAALSGEGGKG